MSSRIEQVRALLQDHPEDTFLRYAMAQELCNAGDLKSGIEVFQALRQAEPDYVGLYYHLGLALLEFDRREEADAIFIEGISRAESAGDRHTADTIRNARLNASI